MTDLFEVLRSVLEQIPAGHVDCWSYHNPETEQIVREMTPAEIQGYEDIHALDADLRLSVRRCLRLSRLLDARRTLYSDTLQHSEERLETADLRGRYVGIRKNAEDTPIIVEFTPQEYS